MLVVRVLSTTASSAMPIARQGELEAFTTGANPCSGVGKAAQGFYTVLQARLCDPKGEGVTPPVYREKLVGW